MEVVPVKIVPRGWGETQRRDAAWWLTPAAVFLGLGIFVVYSTWAAFQNAHYAWGPYLSPFYAPVLWASPGDAAGLHHAWFGVQPSWWPALVPFSPALLILPFPGLFRFTCYYYRGAYYKAFWSDPISCAVGEPRGTHYRGERRFPLVMQNVHRYFAYIAVIFLFLLAYDVWLALWWDDPVTGGKTFGIGLGTLILFVNVCLLSLYTFGCHSIRHLIGGRRDALSTLGVRKGCYDCVGGLNNKHMLFAWCSLFTVGFCDVYIRLCSMGIFHDVRLF